MPATDEGQGKDAQSSGDDEVNELLPKEQALTFSAYFFLICCNWVAPGCHHYYCRRDLQCLVWMSSFCVFGWGWLSDFFLVPSYIAKHNKSPHYLKGVKERANDPEDGEKKKKKKKRPPCCRFATLAQLFTQSLLGMWYGLILSGCAPKDANPQIHMMLGYAGACLGVFVGGHCTGVDRTGSISNVFLWSCWVPYLFMPEEEYDSEGRIISAENNIRAVWVISSLVGCIGFFRSRSYQPVQRPTSRRKGHCSRIAALICGLLLINGVALTSFYFHGSIPYVYS
jgi:hypothetical protein